MTDAARPAPQPASALKPNALLGLQRAAGNQAVAGLIQRRLRVTAKLEAASPIAPVDKVRIGDRPKFWAATDDHFTHVVRRPRGPNEDYRHIVDFETTKRTWEKDLKGMAPADARQALVAGEAALKLRYPNTYRIPARQLISAKPLDPMRELELLKYVIKLEFNKPANLWPGAAGENRSSGSSSRAVKQKLKKLDPASKHRGKRRLESVDDLYLANFMSRLDLRPGGGDAEHLTALKEFRDTFQRGFAKAQKYGDATRLAVFYWDRVYKPEWLKGLNAANRGKVDPNNTHPAYLAGTQRVGQPGVQLPIMRLFGAEHSAAATSRTARVQHVRIQRLLSVAIRQRATFGAKKIEKMRIADRPDGFAQATEDRIGARGRTNAYRHIVEFDVIKRRWKKELKGIALGKALSMLTTGLTDATRRLPRDYKQKSLPIRGRNDVEKVEELLKDVLTIEFNNPNNLWLGDSAENSARGSSAKAARNKLKQSAATSKYEKIPSPLGTPQAIEAKAYENFALRLDLAPDGNTPKHMRQLRQHTSWYAKGFPNTAKYGDSAVLEATFRAAWQLGYTAASNNAVDLSNRDPVYRSGAQAFAVDAQEGYQHGTNGNVDNTRLADVGYKAGFDRFDAEYKRGYLDAGAVTVNAAITTAGYLAGIDDFKKAFDLTIRGNSRPWQAESLKHGERAGRIYLAGLNAAMRNTPPRTVPEFQSFYDDGYLVGKKARTASTASGAKPLQPPKKIIKPGTPAKLTGINKHPGTGKKPGSKTT